MTTHSERHVFSSGEPNACHSERSEESQWPAAEFLRSAQNDKKPTPSAQSNCVGKLLVVRFGDLGDVLTAAPALRALRDSFPQAHITALVSPVGAQVLAGSRLVDDVIAFEKSVFDAPTGIFQPHSLVASARLLRRLHRDDYDTVAIFQHLVTSCGVLKYAALALSTGAKRRVGLDDGRGWFLSERVPDGGFGEMHEADYCLEIARALGAEVRDARMGFAVGYDDHAWARAALGDGRPIVAVPPGSGAYSTARRWPKESFAAVVKALVAQDRARVVVVGGPDEAQLAREVIGIAGVPAMDLAGKTSLQQLAAVLARSNLFIGNDGGIMHLATSMGTPVAAVFGPSNHLAWGPYLHDAARVLRVELPCSPCFYVGHRLGNRQGCPTRDCLRLVTPEMVLEAARNRWRGDRW